MNHVKCKGFVLNKYVTNEINDILEQFDNVVNAQVVTQTHELIVFYKENINQNNFTQN